MPLFTGIKYHDFSGFCPFMLIIFLDADCADLRGFFFPQMRESITPSVKSATSVSKKHYSVLYNIFLKEKLFFFNKF